LAFLSVPFCFNGEWYFIAQEDQQHISTIRTYTINKLPAMNQLMPSPALIIQQQQQQQQQPPPIAFGQRIKYDALAINFLLRLKSHLFLLAFFLCALFAYCLHESTTNNTTIS